MEYCRVNHDSLKPFVPQDAKILILGSFPSPMSRKMGFYYSFSTNRFFKALAGVFHEVEPKTIEERKAFLVSHHIALYDVIESCDIKGASDSSIKNIIPADIKKMIQGTKIMKIFTTGTKASTLYRKYIGQDNIMLPSPSAANAQMSLEELICSYRVIFDVLNDGII